MPVAEIEEEWQSALDRRLRELSRFSALIERWTEQYGEPRCGRHRAVFFDGDRVLKAPRDHDGCLANLREATWDQAGVKLARCRLLDEFEFPVLEMERVVPASLPAALLPAWASEVDCAQLGWSNDGSLVAYDLWRRRARPENTPASRGYSCPSCGSPCRCTALIFGWRAPA